MELTEQSRPLDHIAQDIAVHVARINTEVTRFFTRMRHYVRGEDEFVSDMFLRFDERIVSPYLEERLVVYIAPTVLFETPAGPQPHRYQSIQDDIADTRGQFERRYGGLFEDLVGSVAEYHIAFMERAISAQQLVASRRSLTHAEQILVMLTNMQDHLRALGDQEGLMVGVYAKINTHGEGYVELDSLVDPRQETKLVPFSRLPRLTGDHSAYCSGAESGHQTNGTPTHVEQLRH